jgi:hypothetical protein
MKVLSSGYEYAVLISVLFHERQYCVQEDKTYFLKNFQIKKLAEMNTLKLFLLH